MSDDRNKKPNPAGQSGDRRPDDTGPSLGASGGGFNWGWLLLLGLLFLPSIIGVFTGNRGGSVTYNQFRSQVESGNVEAVTVSGNRIQGRFSSAVTVGSGSNTNEVQRFVVHVPPFGDASLLELMRTNNVPIYTQPAQDGMSLFGVLLNILPFLLLVWIGYRMFKGMQQRGQGMFGVGQNKAKLYERSASVETTFKDVAGLQSAKQEVQEIVDFLKRPERYEKLGGKPPKGVLLVGPPGTGKTLLARAIAGEADTDFYTMSGSDFMEMFVGVGASRVRNLFKDAKKRQPSIIFIDELDSIGRHRGAGLGGGHDEREQTLNQLLSELDGFAPQEQVIVIAATNRPDILDPALLRPGRFDRRVTTNLPSVKDRVAILRIHAQERPLADDVDLQEVARGTPGFSGADLANLLNEASLLAARAGSSELTMDTIRTARDKVMLGLERKNLTISEEERKRIAFHESGHAVTAALLPNADELLKVTIIPRGRAMGVTQQIPEEEKYLYSEEYLADRLSVMLGGRAAEQLVFGSFTNGAENDLQQATKIARRMVEQWGMSRKIGAFYSGGEQKNVFLGEELSRGRDHSETTAREIDAEVMETLRTAYERAKETLEEHRDGLQRLADELLEEEELTAEEVRALIRGKESDT